VVKPLGVCPEDIESIAEAYAMGTLPEAEARTFEDHYITCPACAEAVEDADACVRAMRSAAREIRDENPVRAGAGK
jgi:anti-sigma factor RsiW